MASLLLYFLRKEVRSLARKCLEDRKKDPDALASRHYLLKARSRDWHADDRRSVSENVIFLVAGHETTAHCKTRLFHDVSSRTNVTNVLPCCTLSGRRKCSKRPTRSVLYIYIQDLILSVLTEYKYIFELSTELVCIFHYPSFTEKPLGRQ